MNPKLLDVALRLSVHSFADTFGSAQVATYDGRARLSRAIKTGGACWLSAIAFLFIPVLHFVLVPTALILGPILFFKNLKIKDEIVSGHGECPKCKTFVTVSRQPMDWPIQQNCTSCAALLILSPAN